MSEAVNTQIKGEEIQSKFNVLDKPTIHPGFCICCGSVERPVVDFGIEVDYEALGFGALLLCVSCVTQAALRFPENKPQVVALPVMHEEEYDRIEKALLDGITDGLSVLRTAVCTPVPVYGSSDSVPEQAEPEDPASTEREPDSDDNSGLKVDGDNREQGTAGVSSDSGDGTSSKSDARFILDI